MVRNQDNGHYCNRMGEGCIGCNYVQKGTSLSDQQLCCRSWQRHLLPPDCEQCLRGRFPGLKNSFQTKRM